MKPVKSLFILLPILALFSCGEMNTLIAPSDSYRVGASVSGRDLENGAVIGRGVSFLPLYVPQAEDDPDVVAFKVALQNSAGAAAATTIVYAERGAAPEIDSKTETLILVGRLTDDLPPFALPEDLPIGRYALVFQVVGKDGVLFESSRAFYYTGDQAFSLISVLSYPPGAAPTSGAPLFPVGMRLLLEATVTAGASLDPYIVWSYEGKKISEGRIADGAGRILWTPPAAAGFHRVVASLFPVRPGSGEADFVGLTRTLTVTTSTSAPFPGLGGADSDYSLIFRLLGVRDPAGAEAQAYALAPQGSFPDLWAPFSDGYGLLLDGRRSYRSGYPAAVADGTLHSSSVTIRVAPKRAGVLFRSFLPSESSGGGLAITLSSTAKGFSLQAASGSVSRFRAIELGTEWTGDAYEIKIDFSPTPEGTLSVAAAVDGVSYPSVELPSPADLAAGGYFVLGEDIDEASASAESDDQDAVEPDAELAVFDDVAFSVSPIGSGL
jgi:hypothetical protein